MNEIEISENESLDTIYNLIEELIQDQDWWLLNGLCITWSSEHSTADLDVRLGIATATLPVKNKLQDRKLFIDACKRLYPDVELWKGLE